MIRRLAIALLAFLPLPATAGSDLSGTDGYWELASDLGFDAGANFPITVSAWVRPDTVSGVDKVFCIEDKGDQNRAALQLSAGVSGATVTASGGTATTQAASKTATAGRWYHVVAILDDPATATYVWVDGSFIGGGSGTTRVLADLDTTTLGCSWSGASAAQEFFDGAITNVAVWSVALTEAEVRRLCMDRFSVRKVRPESLVLHCPAEVMTGSVCVDVVGAREFTKNGTIADSSDDGPFGFTPPGLGTWTPASLGALVGPWLKGDAGVTGTAPVTAWADQFGNGCDLDNNGGTGPATVTDGYGGKTGVRFTNDVLYADVSITTSAPIYGFMVAKFANVGNCRFLWIGDKDLNGTEGWSLLLNSAVHGWGADSVAGSNDFAFGTGPGPAVGYTVSIEFDEATSSSRRVSKNGGHQGTNALSNSPLGADRYSLGQRQDSSPDLAAADMTIYELVIMADGQVPTDAQRMLWAVYVKHRWNVTGGPIRYE